MTDKITQPTGAPSLGRAEQEISRAQAAIELARSFPVRGGPVPPQKTSWHGLPRSRADQNNNTPR